MYYPKSQIKTNLYANSNQFVIASNQEGYEGYYYETSTGKRYTGKFPGDGKNLLLISSIPVTNGPEVTNSSNEINLITPFDPLQDEFVETRSIPKYYTVPPKLIPEEGSISRYFCKKRNEYKYIEISKEDHNKLKTNDSSIAYDLYEPISITWEITNQDVNLINIRRIENKLRWVGFSQYVRNLPSLFFNESPNDG